MAYRTILVSLGIDEQAKPRLATALHLAGRHGARVLGYFGATWSDVLYHDHKIMAIDHARRALEDDAKQAGRTSKEHVRPPVYEGRSNGRIRPPISPPILCRIARERSLRREPR